jgi:polyferredoxin
MGIDIRDGLQLECIGCGLCIDACNDVMARVARPPELVTLDTARNQALRAAGGTPEHRIVRPRTLIYGALLLLVAGVMLVGLSARAELDVNIIPERNPLFVTLSDGSIRNGYNIKILNKSHATRGYALTLDGLPGATLAVVGQADDREGHATLAAKPDAVTTYRIYVTAPRAAVTAPSQPLAMILTDPADGVTVRHETVFRGPEA